MIVLSRRYHLKVTTPRQIRCRFVRAVFINNFRHALTDDVECQVSPPSQTVYGLTSALKYLEFLNEALQVPIDLGGKLQNVLSRKQRQIALPSMRGRHGINQTQA